MRGWKTNLCISTTTAGAAGDDVDHRTPLSPSLGSFKPFCSPTSKVEIAAAERGRRALRWIVPSNTSSCLWGSRAAASHPVLVQHSAQHSEFWKTDGFCNTRAGVWPTTSVPSLKTHNLKLGTTESGFVSQKDPPVAASFSISESP